MMANRQDTTCVMGAHRSRFVALIAERRIFSPAGAFHIRCLLTQKCSLSFLKITCTGAYRQILDVWHSGHMMAGRRDPGVHVPTTHPEARVVESAACPYSCGPLGWLVGMVNRLIDSIHRFVCREPAGTLQLVGNRNVETSRQDQQEQQQRQVKESCDPNTAKQQPNAIRLSRSFALLRRCLCSFHARPGYSKVRAAGICSSSPSASLP